MAEHGEIVAGATGLGAFLGALAGAWKYFKPASAPEKGNEMGALLQRVAKLEQRADAHETARTEQRADFGKVFEKLDDLTEIVARLDGKLSMKGGGR